MILSLTLKTRLGGAVTVKMEAQAKTSRTHFPASPAGLPIASFRRA